jgi:hypothetical protein
VKIGDSKAGSLQRLEQTHQAVGRHDASIRSAAEQFWGGLRGDSMKEPMLALRMLVSSSTRGAVDELVRILSGNSGGTIAERHGKLDGWIANNPQVFGSMRKGTREALQNIASGRGQAEQLVAAANEAARAFAPSTPGQQTALDTVTRKAHTEGYVQFAAGRDVRALKQATVMLFQPGTKRALEELAQALERPQQPMERANALQAWQQKNPDVLLPFHFSHDMWIYRNEMQADFLSARQAVNAAFGQTSAS